ncbi:MAG: GGDEF domain-containing protein [Chloroflexi bacterium]|nr:MAG: GGDEF domain-containing protein [Chloroflexota bacterium]
MLVDMTLQSFVSSADLAIAISIAALSVSALRSGRRPRRMRSWLFFALASLTLVVHSAFGTQGDGQAEAAALFELLTLALFAIGFVLLYGADREQLRSIETLAELDPTTGLLNRQAFRELVSAHLRRPRHGPSAVAVVDLDGFKAVNDSRGHPAGDEVLGLVAAAIRANLRAQDLASRYGGDEFVIFLADCPVESALPIMGDRGVRLDGDGLGRSRALRGRRRRARRSGPYRGPRASFGEALGQEPAPRRGDRLSRGARPFDQRAQLRRRDLGAIEIALHDLDAEGR